VVVNFFLSIGEGGEVFVGRVGREEGVRQVLKRVCLVWRERVRLEVGVVVGLFWKGPLGEGGPAGRPSRPPSRTTPGGVGSAFCWF